MKVWFESVPSRVYWGMAAVMQAPIESEAT